MHCDVGTYAFRERTLLESALAHPSSNPNKSGFQRLEFMGDSVLNLVITDALMEMFPNEPEGALSKRRAVLVSRETCNCVGTNLGLHNRIKVGVNVDMANSSIVADAVEAVIGALYIDCGKDMNVCREWIMRQWQQFIACGKSKRPPIDPKTQLQEWAQSQRMQAPVYTEVGRCGPDHDLTIFVSVDIPGMDCKPASGEGRTKKAAEKQAAEKLLLILKDRVDTMDHACNVIRNAAQRFSF